MKKLALLIVVFISFTNSYSQEIYFLTGKNFTSYDYKNAALTNSFKFQMGMGSTYEIGYSKKFEKIYSYNVGLTLNEYNALSGASSYNYNWNTQYVGIQNNFQIRFLKLKYIESDIRAGINMSRIIFGQQTIDGVIYNLVNQKDFSGILFQPLLGIQVKLKVAGQGYLSLGYNRTNSYNLTNNSAEKLSFQTNQLLFGIHFEKK